MGTQNEGKKKPSRMSFNVSPEAEALLNEIADDSCLTINDVLRRAIALLDVAYQAKKQGHRLGILDQDRKLITEYTNIL